MMEALHDLFFSFTIGLQMYVPLHFGHNFKTMLTANYDNIHGKIMSKKLFVEVKLSCTYPDIDPCCDMCKRNEAPLILMFWMCPNLEKH